MHPDIMHVVYTRIRDLRGVQPIDHLRRSQLVKRVDDDRAELITGLRTFGVRQETRIARKRGIADHFTAKYRPFALVLQPKHHDLAVAGGEWSVRIDRR